MGSEWPISRSEYYRREREILFEIELLLYHWGISEFAFDEEEQVFRDRNGMIILSRHYVARGSLFEDK
jgi:hypothetical protein